MQRGLVHALAWSLATGAAVTLSWWGVHTVMAGTAYDPPRAVPLAVGARAGQDTREPVSSSTRRPAPSASSPAATPRTTPPAATRTPSRTPSRKPSRSPAPARSSATTGASGEVKSYRTDGGRVVFELGASSAKLVSATPEPDWSMQVWTNTTWIRVNFSDETGATYSVFCTWNDHPPLVQIVGP